jgi:hypothetical protein
MCEIKIDAKTWEAGYNAGYKYKPSRPPAGVDVYSWSSGYIEGKGDRQMGKPSQCQQVHSGTQEIVS